VNPILSDPRSRRPPLDGLRVLVWCILVPLPWIVLAVIVARTWGL
jgi:hypothetical protein